MRSYLHGVHFCIRDFATFLVALSVKFALDFKSSACPGSLDQINHRLVGVQRFVSPIDRDEREQPMLNLVLTTRPWRKVARRDRQLLFVSKPLQFKFPQPRAVAVAATAICDDQ